MTSRTILTCGYCGQSLPEFAKRCPRCEHDVGISAIDDGIKSTVLEQVANVEGNGQGGDTVHTGKVVPYRPVCRPRRAMLCVLDDGSDEGEWIRIRSDCLSIGRVEGDVVVGDDPKVSGKHAEIVRKVIGGYSRWYLRDLKSTNGTFAKVGSAKLTANSEIIIGLRRFVFQMPELAESSAVAPQRNVTQGWAIGAAVKQELPKLVELESQNPITFELVMNSNKIGSSSEECDMVIPDDPTVEPLHAEIVMDRNGNWKLNALPSLNGTWLRIDEVRIDHGCHFQAGEQRFKVRVI